MIKAPISFDEKQRTLALLNLKILDTEKEDAYDELAELAGYICDSEIAGISFIEQNRQWFKASVNITPKELPRDISFCGHAIIQDNVMIVDDVFKDERFLDNPNVLEGNKIRFYAGAPIICNGQNIGTVCVFDTKMGKKISEKQVQGLKIIASQVTKLLELRQSNEEIKALSNKLILTEKHLASVNISKSEERNDEIAYQLHENIAQLLVATKIQIDVIRKNDVPYKDELVKVNEYLSIILNDVINLSNSITPTTYSDGEYLGFIERMLEKAKSLYMVDIIFLQTGENIDLKSTFGLTFFRIIQYQLFFSTMAEASKIKFALDSKNGNATILTFEHDGNIELCITEQADFFYNNILNRAEYIGATLINDIMNKRMVVSLHNNNLEI